MCAGCSLHLSRRTHNEYRACAPRVPVVGPSLPEHVRRPSDMYIYASSCSAHNFVHAHKKTRRTKRMATNESRWSSALDERVTNDDEQRRTNHFSVRSSCVLHASTRCDRAIRQPQPRIKHEQSLTDVSALPSLRSLVSGDRLIRQLVCEDVVMLCVRIIHTFPAVHG